MEFSCSIVEVGLVRLISKPNAVIVRLIVATSIAPIAHTYLLCLSVLSVCVSLLTKLVVEILPVDEHPLPVSVAALGLELPVDLKSGRLACRWEVRCLLDLMAFVRATPRQRNLPLMCRY